MAKPNIAELKVIAADLQKQCDYVKKMIGLQENDSTENKNCEKYSHVPGKCVTGRSNSNKGNSFCTKRKTAKRKERRNKSSSNSLHFQKTTGEKYLKNLSKNN